MHMSDLLRCSAAGLLLIVPALAGAQQSYPARPIRIIVPAAPGGGTDYTARFIGQKLSDEIGRVHV